MSDHSSLRARLGRLLASIAACVLVFWPAAASAHTDFESSTPTDGETVDGPLSEVIVEFTNPAEPAGEGFELLDPSGVVRAPTSIDPTDGTAFVLTFDPALTDGTYGLRWQVRAGDAHPIDGSFSFTVVGAAPTTTTPTTTAPPSTSAPSAIETTVPAIVAPVTTGPPTDLDTFLAAGDGATDDAAWVGRVGRTFTFLGLIFGLGTVAALVWVIRGRRDEITAELNWIRLAGLAIALGGFIEWAGLHMTHDAVATELLQTKAGVAVALKIVGGLAVVAGFHAGVGEIDVPGRSLSAATLSEPVTRPGSTPSDARWRPTSSALIGLVGLALVVASFWFDGHTVSRGWWPLHAAVDLVHVVAAAVWAGGVFAMTTVVWMRRRNGLPTETAQMIVRFSSVAAISLAALTVAGAIMTYTIVESFDDVVSTQWGRVLIAKLFAVAVAAGIGAFNHFRLRPALEQRPDDPALAVELRRTLTIESTVFFVIVVLTSWLVAAAV